MTFKMNRLFVFYCDKYQDRVTIDFCYKNSLSTAIFLHIKINTFKLSNCFQVLAQRKNNCRVFYLDHACQCGPSYRTTGRPETPWRGVHGDISVDLSSLHKQSNCNQRVNRGILESDGWVSNTTEEKQFTRTKETNVYDDIICLLFLLFIHFFPQYYPNTVIFEFFFVFFTLKRN